MQKNDSFLSALSYWLMCICAVLLILCAGLFAYGQYRANQSILLAGEAVLGVTGSNSQEQIDYTGAITYLEAAQHAYSENSMVRLTSIIYILASTIILGYGAKLLRIGKDEKDELMQTLHRQMAGQLSSSATKHQKSIEELYDKTTKQLNEQTVKHQESLEKAKEQILKSFDYGSILLNSSGNALHLCLLFQSGLEMIPLFSDEEHLNIHLSTVERVGIEIIHSLQLLLEYLEILDESNLPLNKELQDMISHNLILLRRAFEILSSTKKPDQINDDYTIEQLLLKCENLCKQ